MLDKEDPISSCDYRDENRRATHSGSPVEDRRFRQSPPPKLVSGRNVGQGYEELFQAIPMA